jgi:hypothetical protein
MTPPQFRWIFVPALCVLTLGPAVGAALATPEKAIWRRQTLIGENSDSFFRYVTISEHPGSYYTYSRSLRIEKVQKKDLHVVESHPLESITYSQDSDTQKWSSDVDTLPAFDLPAFLRANAVTPAFGEELFFHRNFVIDKGGVWEVFEDGRHQVMTRAELERQIPDLGEEPRVVGIEDANPGIGEGKNIYLRICSNSSSWDDDWSEDIVILPEGAVH